jgi:hypothetical protein
MADNGSTDTSQAGASGREGDTDGQDTAAASQAGVNGTGVQQFDAEYVQKIRSEAASYRTKYANAQKRLDDLERGQMTELDKLKTDLQARDEELSTLRQKARIADAMNAAAKAGAVYPDAVARLVPSDSDDYDSALKEIRKTYPAMFRQQGSADAGAGTNGKPLAGDFSDMIRQAAGRG